MANIQIPEELFFQLIQYHIFDDYEHHESIVDALEKKLDTMVLRDLYSKSKMAPTPEEREKARQEYLYRRGIHQDFRWDNRHEKHSEEPEK